jgi:hypothetical protein
VDADQLKRTLRERVGDVIGLLERQTPQARQMLRKLLADKIELEPVGEGRERGYRFRGALTIEKLIAGEALLTHLSVVAPTGYALGAVSLKLSAVAGQDDEGALRR